MKEQLVEISVPTKVLATAPLNLRVGREKPEVSLTQMSDGSLAVMYSAWGSLHETRFPATDYEGAVENFNRITGQPTKPWRPRRVSPARVGNPAA
jgi:hypothetical protein